MADFWLDLDMKPGAAKRAANDPSSPFRVRGGAGGAQGEVAEWDLAWRLQEMVRILANAESECGRSAAEAFLLGSRRQAWASPREMSGSRRCESASPRRRRNTVVFK